MKIWGRLSLQSTTLNIELYKPLLSSVEQTGSGSISSGGPERK